MWTALILATFGVGYWKIAQGKLESQKAEVMAKQRAVAQVLAPKVVPHMERIEGWVRELGGEFRGDAMAEGLSLAEVEERPGIYLRVHIDAAQEQKELRRAASSSLLDGFVACLFVRRGEADPTVGPPCGSSLDCEPGLVCGEHQVCLRPPRPFNLRLAYGALRVLTSDWSDELHEANNELKVRAFERELERVSKQDVALAVQVMDKAEIFTAVLDETPDEGLPERLEGIYETTEERVQRVPHQARVGIWEIATGRQLLRVRARAEGRFIAVGERSAEVASDAGAEAQRRNQAAQRRQANSCALALAVKGFAQARGASGGSGSGGGSGAGVGAKGEEGAVAAPAASGVAPAAERGPE